MITRYHPRAQTRLVGPPGEKRTWRHWSCPALTAGSAAPAKTAAAKASTRKGGCAAYARSAGAPASASMGGSATSARSAAAKASTSTGGCAEGAQRVQGVRPLLYGVRGGPVDLRYGRKPLRTTRLVLAQCRCVPGTQTAGSCL